MAFVSFTFATSGGIMYPAQFPPNMAWMLRGSVAYYAFEVSEVRDSRVVSYSLEALLDDETSTLILDLT